MTKLGHEQPNFDFRAQPEDSLLSRSSNGALAEFPADAATEQTEAPIKPVEEIMAEHEVRVAERAAKWEELTNANWPPGRVEQALDALFPDLRSPEKIEEISIKEDAAVRRQARKTTRPKRHRSPAQNPGIRRLPGYDKVIPPEAR